MANVLLIIDPSKIPLMDSIREYINQKRQDYTIQYLTVTTPGTSQQSVWQKPAPVTLFENIDQVWALLPGDIQSANLDIVSILTYASEHLLEVRVYCGVHELMENIPLETSLNVQQLSESPVSPRALTIDELSHRFIVYQEPTKPTNGKIKTIIYKAHSLLVKMIHPIRVAIIPSGSKREDAYYRFRLFLRKALFYIPENLWRLASIKDYFRWHFYSFSGSIRWRARSAVDTIRWWFTALGDILRWQFTALGDILRWQFYRASHIFIDQLWRLETVGDFIRWRSNATLNTLEWYFKSALDVIEWQFYKFSQIFSRQSDKVDTSSKKAYIAHKRVKPEFAPFQARSKPENDLAQIREKPSFENAPRNTFIARQMDIPRGYRRRSMIMPRWWTTIKDTSIYDQLDAFWEKHPDCDEHVIYITSTSLRQDPNSRSARIAKAIQAQGCSLVYAYFRFSNQDLQQVGENPDGIFMLPIDRLWARPDRVFYNPHAPSVGKRRILIDFPHPSLFRILAIARQMGWSLIYEPADNWSILQQRGLAYWYCSWFEHYLSLNVDCDSSINPIWEDRMPDKTLDKLEKEMAPDPKSSKPMLEVLIPDWWSHSQRDEEAFAGLTKFINQQNKKPGCVVIFSGVLFTKSEGQRATWLTRAFNQMGIPVIFTYFRFGGQDKATQDPNFPMVYQFPIDQLWAFPEQFLNTIRPLQGQKLFLMEFPHPALIRLIHLFQCHGWSTVYEIIDDWREFKKVGQADWYFDHVDAYIHHASQHISATSEALVEHAEVMSGRKVHLIQNAFEAGSLPISSTPRDLPRGRITIGYFGHLTSSWFDWDLLVGVARRHPEWIFHVIGYGYDAKLTLPDNILLLGKIAHDDLPHFAANWDVAMIPFKTSRLSRGVNPIKVYEYLELHLPVVTCGMPHLSQMPFVHNVESMEEFEKQILQAAETQPDQQIISAFLEKNTWTYRAECLLNLSETVEVTK